MPGGWRAAAASAPRALDRFRFLNTTLDSEDSSNNMKQTFSVFLGSVAAASLAKNTADLDASLAGFGGR